MLYIFQLLSCRGDKRRNEKLASSHANGTSHQQPSSTPRLNDNKAGQGGHDVDDLDDEGFGVWAVDSRTTKKGRAIVHDKVDAGELLKHLQATAGEGAAGQMRRADKYLLPRVVP